MICLYLYVYVGGLCFGFTGWFGWFVGYGWLLICLYCELFCLVVFRLGVCGFIGV